MDFYFKPQPGALKDNILRVQPDILPPGSVRLEAVWINGKHYADFDAEAMTIKLPSFPEGQVAHPLQKRPSWAGNPALLPATDKEELRIHVRIVPAGLTYDMELVLFNGTATLTLVGGFDDSAELAFKLELDKIAAAQPTRFVLRMEDLRSISDICARRLAFGAGHLDIETKILIVGASRGVKEVLQRVGVLEQMTLVDGIAEIESV